MKLWKMVAPRNSVYASASVIGAWSEGALCRECTGSTEQRIQPAIVEWDAGSDKVGDFTDAGSSFLVRATLLAELKTLLSGFEAGPIEFVQSAPTPKCRKRAKPRVWLPYSGEPLVELWVVQCGDVNPQRTTAKLLWKCSMCGRERYDLQGHEEHRYKVNGATKRLQVRPVPRRAGHGLSVVASSLNGAEIFRVNAWSGWVLCTDRVKAYIQKRAFSNITFL